MSTTRQKYHFTISAPSTLFAVKSYDNRCFKIIGEYENVFGVKQVDISYCGIKIVDHHIPLFQLLDMMISHVAYWVFHLMLTNKLSMSAKITEVRMSCMIQYYINYL